MIDVRASRLAPNVKQTSYFSRGMLLNREQVIVFVDVDAFFAPVTRTAFDVSVSGRCTSAYKA